MGSHRQKTNGSRDDWQTPPWVMVPLVKRFKFTGDAAASATNSVAPAWLSEADDSLTCSWDSLGARVWMNPPYSQTKHFIARAEQESRQNGRLVACLVPSSMCVPWSHLARSTAQEIWFYRSRISFISPITGEALPANPIGSMLIVFHGEQSYAGYRDGSLCAKTGLPFNQEDRIYWFRNRFTA